MPGFTSFVVLAEMRTGSNLLETHLNSFEGITCHGELFNPVFINKPRCHEYAGVTFAQREADPLVLLDAVRAGGGMVGFRLFHDHDPRIRAHVLGDPACAKIVLTRNPLDSYLSRKIAAATDQWKLMNVARLRSARVQFDPAEFEAHVERHQNAQRAILQALQTSGQSAFYIGYDDLNDVTVLNGLAQWLGVMARIEAPSRQLKKQNPEPALEKVTNPDAIPEGLARLDRFDLGRTPNFEPRRPPMLPACVTAARSRLLFMPLRGSPEAGVAQWLAALDGVGSEALGSELTAARLSAWKRANPGFRSFSVLRHPLRRAWAMFHSRVLSGDVKPVVEHLTRLYQVDLKAARRDPGARQTAFLAYLRFVRASLNGQTGLQPWPFWASQAALLEGFCQHAAPDHLLREEHLARDLPLLVAEVDGPVAPVWPVAPGSDWPAGLEQPPLDAEILAAAREAYWRDYEQFGFDETP